MRAGLVGLLLWLAALFGARADDAVQAPPDDPARQVLVMLAMVPEHTRAGGGYAGAYGDLAGRSLRRRLALQVAQDHGLRLDSGWPMPTLGVECFVMHLPPAQADAPQALLQALGRDPRVAWAQPMNVYRTQAHDDPLFPVQPAAATWHLADLHQVATGRGVRIAIIDSGVAHDHPDLLGQFDDRVDFVAGARFAAERHGTQVAGVVAALADNHLGMVGIAPRARLLALRACRQDDPATGATCTSLGLAQALDYAIAQRVHIINLSLSGPRDGLLARLLDLALARGIAVVASVDRALRGGGFPAAHPGVLAVADQESGAAEAGVLLAPGRDVPATGPPARWDLVSGSSFAAAHVSGLLALLREAGTARAAAAGAPLEPFVRLPGGAIDACASLLRRTGPCACACATAATAPGKPP